MGTISAVVYVVEEPRRGRALQALTTHGVEPVAAGSGRELGALTERHHPAFLVLDGPLSPDSGVEPLTWLRKAGLDLPAVFLCGSRYESDALERHPELSPYVTAAELNADLLAELVARARLRADDAVLGASGSLGQVDGGELLIHALRQRWTGRLVLESGGIAKTIFLAAGMPVYCSSNILSENLGRMLLKRGIITQADYERARELQLKESIRQGEALVRLGVVDPNDLEQYLYDQVYEKLLHALAWTAGQYSFTEDQDFRQRITVFHLNPVELLVEAQTRFHAPREAPARWPRLRHLWGASRRERADVAALVHRVIPPEMRRALAEPQLLCDLAEAHQLDAVHALALFSTLERSGYLELATRRELLLPDPKVTPPEALRAATGRPERVERGRGSGAVVSPDAQTLLERLYEAYFRGDEAEPAAILGLDEGAAPDDVARARDGLLARFSEDNYRSLLSRAEHAKALKRVRERIERAAAELLDPKRGGFSRHDNTTRTTREVSMKKLVKAEEAFQQGMLTLDANPSLAREYFDKANSLHPKDPLYLLYSGWSGYLCAADDGQRAEARRQIERAVEANPIFSEGHVFLARVLRDAGKIAEAIDEANTALTFDHENRPAKALLRDLEATRRQPTPPRP